MDYSKFVEAILQNDDSVISKQVKVITRVLIKFLMVRLGASFHDAEDCAQTTLLIAINKIRDRQLDHPEAIINYLFTTAKHEYFRVLSKNREINYEDLPEHHSIKADQLDKLLVEEKLTVLQDCLAELRADHKEFIEFWFNHPAYEAAVVADHFGISVSNVWTKKHRIIQILNECLEQKLKL